ncbi:MAG: hypothetical protein QOD90_1920 [Mycobacterium sp.]|nr:hypothetical protein [Mycobacterium sp.]
MSYPVCPADTCQVSSTERGLMATIPEGYESLLERPLFGHLATVRPTGFSKQ